MKLNRVDIIGRITKPIEIKTTKNGKTFGRLNVMVNRDYKNKTTDQYDSDILFFTVFGNQIDFIKNYTTTGSPVYIEGKLIGEFYKNENQQDVYKSDIILQNVKTLETKDNFEARVARNNAKLQNVGNVPTNNYQHQPITATPATPNPTATNTIETNVGNHGGNSDKESDLPWEE